MSSCLQAASQVTSVGCAVKTSGGPGMLPGGHDSCRGSCCYTLHRGAADLDQLSAVKACSCEAQRCSGLSYAQQDSNTRRSGRRLGRNARSDSQDSPVLVGARMGGSVHPGMTDLACPFSNPPVSDLVIGLSGAGIAQ